MSDSDSRNSKTIDHTIMKQVWLGFFDYIVTLNTNCVYFLLATASRVSDTLKIAKFDNVNVKTFPECSNLKF